MQCDWWCRSGNQRSWPACQSSATWTNDNHRLWLWSESDWAATCPGRMNWQSIACWTQWHTRSSCGRERGTLVSITATGHNVVTTIIIHTGWSPLNYAATKRWGIQNRQQTTIYLWRRIRTLYCNLYSTETALCLVFHKATTTAQWPHLMT